jgi:hypothetical protein
MHVLRWKTTLNLQAQRAALTVIRVGSCSTRQRFYSQPARHSAYADQPLSEKIQRISRANFRRRVKEYRGRDGVKFEESSAPLAASALGKQAEVLILSDPGKSDRELEGNLDGTIPGSLENAVVNESSDNSNQLEIIDSLEDKAAQEGPGDVHSMKTPEIDSKYILETLENEESNVRDDDMVSKQIESIRPQFSGQEDHPVISQEVFRKISTSINQSFTTPQLKTYHNNYLKAHRETFKTSSKAQKRFWGEKWDPLNAELKSRHPVPQLLHKNDKSKIIDSIIKSLWKVEVKAKEVEVGSVKGRISEFHFALLSSGGKSFVIDWVLAH